MGLFRLDEYNDAARRVVYRWIQARAMELAPSLRLFPRIEVEHVRTSRVTLPDGTVERIPPSSNQDGGRFDIREVVDGRFSQFRESLDLVAHASARTQVAYWQEQVDRGLAPGTVAKVKGPPSWDSLMDALEDLAIGFDDAGEPTFKSVAGPAAAEIVARLGARTAEQERRWQALMRRKKEEWVARQRDRRMA